MPDLTEFLLARIAEDEAAARECEEWPDCYACPTHERFDSARVLADVEARRRIVAWDAEQYVGYGILELLALSYADHADFQEEWRP